MSKDDKTDYSRREFIKTSGLTALGSGVVGVTSTPVSFAQTDNKVRPKEPHEGRYNILMIVTDQERHMSSGDLPVGYQLPGHERLAKDGIVFENHQVASCVCPPSPTL